MRGTWPRLFKPWKSPGRHLFTPSTVRVGALFPGSPGEPWGLGLPHLSLLLPLLPSPRVPLLSLPFFHLPSPRPNLPSSLLYPSLHLPVLLSAPFFPLPSPKTSHSLSLLPLPPSPRIPLFSPFLLRSFCLPTPPLPLPASTPASFSPYSSTFSHFLLLYPHFFLTRKPSLLSPRPSPLRFSHLPFAPQNLRSSPPVLPSPRILFFLPFLLVLIPQT